MDNELPTDYRICRGLLKKHWSTFEEPWEDVEEQDAHATAYKAAIDAVFALMDEKEFMEVWDIAFAKSMVAAGYEDCKKPKLRVVK